MNSSKLWTPASGKEINAKWLEDILGNYESRSTPGTTVKVVDFEVNPGVKEGENFSSELIKFHISALVKGSSSKTSVEEIPEEGAKKEYNLLAKFLQFGAFVRELAMGMGAPLREATLYSDVMPTLMEFVGNNEKLRLLIPDFICGVCREGEYVLVMDDVRLAGYLNNDKIKGLSLNQCLIAVEKLAQLHAISYAYNEKRQRLTDKFPHFKPDSIFPRLMLLVYHTFYDVATDIAQIKNLKVHETMKRNRDAFKCNTKALVDINNRRISCLCHGDFWNNNFMFKPKDKDLGDPSSIMLLDWGAVQWGNPFLDLQYIIHTSTTRAFRKDHREEVLQHYFTTFTDTTTALGVAVPSWGQELFLEELSKLRQVGVVMGVAISMITMSKVSENISKERNAEAAANLDSAGISWKIGARLGKLAASSFMKPAAIPLMRKYFKNITKAGIKEVKSGENETLNTRIFELLDEAEELGVFDI